MRALWIANVWVFDALRASWSVRLGCLGRPPLSAPCTLRSHVVLVCVCVPHSTDYIEDVEPLVNKFVSVPKDYGSLNCAAFIAGVIHGVLLASGFVRADGRFAGASRLSWYPIVLSSHVISVPVCRPGVVFFTGACLAWTLPVCFLIADVRFLCGWLVFSALVCPPPRLLLFVCGVTRDGPS